MSDNTVNMPLAIDVPPVPTRLRTPAMGVRAGVDIGEVSDEILRAVGEQWTEKLIAEAATQRAEAKKTKKAPANKGGANK